MAVAVCSAAVAAAFAYARPPVPRIHDEFSYLLAADTFAAGRVTNPPHPLWTRFEAHHVLQQPTYMSKYPPAQGLALAAGQASSGSPIVGAWASMAAACVGIYWALLAWHPQRWALAGTVLAVSALAIGRPEFNADYAYWSRTYWGGAVAACGGALVLGAWKRLRDKPSRRDGYVFAIGIAILANSRPMEGALFGLLLAVALAFPFRRGAPTGGGVTLRALVIPLIVVLAPCAAAMAYYNWRVAGDARVLPYVLYERTHSITPFILWQPLRTEPSYRHQSMRDFHIGMEPRLYLRQRGSRSGLVRGAMQKMNRLWSFYLGALLTIPFFLALRSLHRPYARTAIVLLAAFLVLFLQLTWARPHYVAPVAALVFVVVVEGLRRMAACRRGWPSGQRVALAIVIVAVVRVPVLVAFTAASQRFPVLGLVDQGYQVHRQRILELLEHTSGNHLVLVRYDLDHPAAEEWVYNRADIDAAKVVWARAASGGTDADLLEYFRGRRVWVLYADSWRRNPAGLLVPLGEGGGLPQLHQSLQR